MVILAVVFIACAGAGVAAGARWLPHAALTTPVPKHSIRSGAVPL